MFYVVLACAHLKDVPRLMQAAFDYAVEYVHTRKQFGKPIGTFQLMQGSQHHMGNVPQKWLKPYFSEDCGHVHETKRKSRVRIRCC